MTIQLLLEPRAASAAGEILVVHTLNFGVKVLVDFCDRDDVVELQLYRKARLVEIPHDIRLRYGINETAMTVFLHLPNRDGCNKGFSFDGSIRNAVYLQELPDGLLVEVLPEVNGVRAFCHRPQPIFSSSAAVAVVA